MKNNTGTTTVECLWCRAVTVYRTTVCAAASRYCTKVQWKRSIASLETVSQARTGRRPCVPIHKVHDCTYDRSRANAAIRQSPRLSDICRLPKVKAMIKPRVC